MLLRGAVGAATLAPLLARTRGRARVTSRAVDVNTAFAVASALVVVLTSRFAFGLFLGHEVQAIASAALVCAATASTIAAVQALAGRLLAGVLALGLVVASGLASGVAQPYAFQQGPLRTPARTCSAAPASTYCAISPTSTDMPSAGHCSYSQPGSSSAASRPSRCMPGRRRPAPTQLHPPDRMPPSCRPESADRQLSWSCGSLALSRASSQTLRREPRRIGSSLLFVETWAVRTPAAVLGCRARDRRRGARPAAGGG